MHFRLLEGNGKRCSYMIGLLDDGTPIGVTRGEMIESLESLCNGRNQ